MAELGEANVGGRLVPAWLLDLTAEELDSLKSRWYSNPNLLDNWYFGNLVDQRGGYVVPPNTPYFSDAAGNTQVGTTTAYVTTRATGPGWVISVSGREYYVAYANVIRGYTGDWKYSFDRWRISPSSTVYISGGGLSVLADFQQAILSTSLILGQKYTMSVLSTDGQLGQLTFTLQQDVDINTGFGFGFFVIFRDSNKYWFRLYGTNEATYLAIKLELGSTQTLAHREGDKWVLNEIPDYGEQLRRCQRYFVNFNPYKMRWFAMTPAVATSKNQAYSAVTLPVAMRTQPTATYGGNIVLSQASDNRVTGIMVSEDTFTGNSIQLRYDVGAGGLTANSLYRVQGYNDPTSYIHLSADL